MYHPATRLLTILELLQSRGHMGGAELAARLEVELRTVRRYIAMLQDMGIPVETTRGPGGGYRLRPGFKLPPLMFTDDEALAITLSLIATRRQGIPADPHALEGALAKIERVLPEGLRSRVQTLQSSVRFVVGHVPDQPPSKVILLLSNAVERQCRVQLRYRSGGEETERGVDPYGIVSHWGLWYVVGWCHLRQGVRLFRLDRIVDAEVEKTRFTRPPDFNSLEYVLESLAKAPQGWAVEVLLETSLEQAQQFVPPGVAILEESTAGVIFRGYVERLDWFARVLLKFECSFVIRKPVELREALNNIGQEAKNLAERRE